MPLAEAVRFSVSDCDGAELLMFTVRLVVPPVMIVGFTAVTLRLAIWALCKASNSVPLLL